MKRVHLIAAWLAVVSLLIDGVLPTAMSAAAPPDILLPFAVCGTGAGGLLPGHAPAPLPVHHCALCSVCAGSTTALLPGRAEALTATSLAGNALPAVACSTPFPARRNAYAAAQPRAPPEIAS